MPQKRNPVPLEHVRILASKALTQSQAVIGCLHNTPFTDINDSEDDLQPMAYSAFDDAERSLRLMAGVLEEVDVCTARMAACADANFLTVTELADTLVRSTGMSFRTAHEIVSKAVKELHGNYDAAKMAALVVKILTEQYSHFSLPSIDVLVRAMSAEHFVALRKIEGGPAPEALDPEIKRARQLVTADRQKLHEHQTRFSNAREHLREESKTMLASGDVA
jgi:argininosuccinate lyase